MKKFMIVKAGYYTEYLHLVLDGHCYNWSWKDRAKDATPLSAEELTCLCNHGVFVDDNGHIVGFRERFPTARAFVYNACGGEAERRINRCLNCPYCWDDGSCTTFVCFMESCV